jgi:hypothetical protein
MEEVGIFSEMRRRNGMNFTKDEANPSPRL